MRFNLNKQAVFLVSSDYPKAERWITKNTAWELRRFGLNVGRVFVGVVFGTKENARVLP